MPHIRVRLNRETVLFLVSVVLLLYLFFDAIRNYYTYYVIYYALRDIYNVYKRFVEDNIEFVRGAPERNNRLMQIQ